MDHYRINQPNKGLGQQNTPNTHFLLCLSPKFAWNRCVRHSVGCCCVADTVLAEFWANMVGNTTNVISDFRPVQTFTVGTASGSYEPNLLI